MKLSDAMATLPEGWSLDEVGDGFAHSETHSTKWTVLISLFYFCLALCIGCVVYHVAALVM